MSEDNTSWEIATRGSGRRKGAAQSLIFSNIPGSLTTVLPDESSEFKRLSSALSRHLRELSYCNALCTSICDSIQASFSDDVVDQDIFIECVGLGRVISSATNGNSIVQLAFLLLINRIASAVVNRLPSINRELLSQDYEEVDRLQSFDPTSDSYNSEETTSSITKQRVCVWEPLFSNYDIKVLHILGFSAFASPWKSRAVDEDGRVNPKNVTILYMPHCPLRLYTIALHRFWGKDLERLILIGNTMGEQDTSQLGKSDCVQRLLTLSRQSSIEQGQESPPLTISSVAIEELVSRRAVGDLSYIFGPPMSSTSLHTFQVLSPLGLGEAPELDLFTLSLSIEE
jgi:hypothetical protein